MFFAIVKSTFYSEKVSACDRPRLTYATQSCRPSKIEIKKLESCWHGCLRRMVKGGFRNQLTEPVNDTNFSLVYTNDEILCITKCHPLREFIDTQ